MANKFGFGSIGTRVKSNGKFPGMQNNTFGQFLHAPALVVETGAQVEMGEIVALVGDTPTNYTVRSLAAGDTATTKTALILRDTVGQNVIEDGIIYSAKRNVAYSIALLNEQNNIEYVVPYDGLGTVSIGDPVFIGLGTNSTVAGSTYEATATGRIALTGYVYTKLPHKPSDNDALAITIGRKVY